MRKILALLLCCSVWAADFTIKASPGDRVIVEVIEGNGSGGTIPPSLINLAKFGFNLCGADNWNMNARMRLFVNTMRLAQSLGGNKYRLFSLDNNFDNSTGTNYGSPQPLVVSEKPYLVSFDYTSSPSFTASNATVKNFVASNGKATAELYISRDNVPIDVTFNANASNMKINLPGYPLDTTKVFSDEALAFLSYANGLRAMDATDTNIPNEPQKPAATAPLYEQEAYKIALANYNRHMGERTKYEINGRYTWESRKKPSELLWSGPYGLPIEIVIDLAIALDHCDLYLSIPHRADMTWWKGTLEYAKSKNYKGKLYFQISNEPWNDGTFGQDEFLIADALMYESGPHDAGRPLLRENANENDVYLMYKHLALLMRNYKQMADSILPNQNVAVMDGQHVDPSKTVDSINWLRRMFPGDNTFRAIAFAPYFYISSASYVDPETAYQAGMKDMLNRQYYPWWKAIAAALSINGEPLELLHYEDGLDGGSQNTVNLAQKIQAQFDPRMKAMILNYMQIGYLFDVDYPFYFQSLTAFDRWGVWGAVDDIARPCPKFDGLKQFVSEDASTWLLGMDNTILKVAPALPNNKQGLRLTVPLNPYTRVDKTINFAWKNWQTGGIYFDPNVKSTEAKNKSVIWDGYYIMQADGIPMLSLAIDTSDVGTITYSSAAAKKGDRIAVKINYTANFSNGTASIKLLQTIGDKKYVVPRYYLTTELN